MKFKKATLSATRKSCVFGVQAIAPNTPTVKANGNAAKNLNKSFIFQFAKKQILTNAKINANRNGFVNNSSPYLNC